MYKIFKIKVLQAVKNTPVFLLDIEREWQSFSCKTFFLLKSQVQKMDVGTIMRKKRVTLIQDQKNLNFIRK